MSGGDTVRIRYHRPPDRLDVFTQRAVFRSPDAVVTLMEATPLTHPLVANDTRVLDDGSPVVWFTFPECWHDIGRFHLPDGTFTGFYANILTPVQFLDADTWETTDLFLDVWIGADGSALLLDADELDAAEANGAVDARTARRAHAEAKRLLAAAHSGTWPPPVVREWTLERARAAVAHGTPMRPQV